MDDQVKKESIRGYLYIVVNIFFMQLFIGLTSFAVIFAVSWYLGVGFLRFFEILKEHWIIATILSLVLSILLSWFVVWYVAWRGILKSFHSPLQIALWMAAIDVVISYEQLIQNPLWFTGSLMIGVLPLFYFLDRTIKQLDNPT